MRTLYGVLFVILFCSCAAAQKIQFPQAKLHIVNGYTFFVCEIDGLNKRVAFLFDTGSDSYIPGTEFLELIKIKSDTIYKVKVGDIPLDLTIKPAHADRRRDTVFAMMFPDFLENHLFGGIVGNPSFAGKYLILDYRTNILQAINGEREPSKNEVSYAPLHRSQNQLFVKANLNAREEVYLHLDNGIPDYSVIEYETAKRAKFDSLRNVPNTSNEVVQAFEYNEEGEPISMTSRVVAKTNHDEPAVCTSFSIGTLHLGTVRFHTMDTDMDSDVFPSSLKPIVGSVGFDFLKNYKIHLDLINNRIAFE